MNAKRARRRVCFAQRGELNPAIRDETLTRQVVAGLAASGAAALTSGNFSMPAVNNPAGLGRINEYRVRVPAASPVSTIYQEAISGSATLASSSSPLLPETAYDVYIAARDTVAPTPNLQLEAEKIELVMPSRNALLTALEPGAGALRPPFAQGLYTYSLFLDGASNSSLALTAVPTAEYVGSMLLSVNGSAAAALTSNVQTSVALAYGLNVLSLNVTAQDSVTVVPYVINVYRQASSDVSNATLAILSVRFDTGAVVNSTQMGGAPWPACVLGCTAADRKSVV